MPTAGGDTAHRVLAIDLGKTGCRARIQQAAEGEGQAAEGRSSVVTGEGHGAAGLADPGGEREARDAVIAVLEGLGQPTMPGARACVGAAGAIPGAARTALAADLAQRLELSTCAVTSDAITAHVGALAGAPGVVLSVGTGAVAIAVSASGAVHVVDGVGQWVGDEGSGAWIGLEGLRAALRAVDGRGLDTALVGAARQRFGEPAQIPVALSADGNVPRTAAAFAPDVLACAAGDRVAADIIERATAALAGTKLAAARAIGGGPAAVVGGLVRWGEPLLGPWRAALAAEGVDVVDSRGGSLDGASVLAVRTDLPHESHVVRHH